jgi:hypothetical protein
VAPNPSCTTGTGFAFGGSQIDVLVVTQAFCGRKLNCSDAMQNGKWPASILDYCISQLTYQKK